MILGYKKKHCFPSLFPHFQTLTSPAQWRRCARNHTRQWQSLGLVLRASPFGHLSHFMELVRNHSFNGLWLKGKSTGNLFDFPTQHGCFLFFLKAVHY